MPRPYTTERSSLEPALIGSNSKPELILQNMISYHKIQPKINENGYAVEAELTNKISLFDQRVTNGVLFLESN